MQTRPSKANRAHPQSILAGQGRETTKQGGAERRRSPRKPHKAPFGLMMVAGSLVGETEDLSRGGLLLRAEGAISVTVKVDGRELSGRLVRVQRLDEKTFAYGVQLDREQDDDDAS